MRSFAILFALVAFSFANSDISVSTSLTQVASGNSNNHEFIAVQNLLPASTELSNSVESVEFYVLGLFQVAYPSGARKGSVGTILPGATGSGAFSVDATSLPFGLPVEFLVEVNYTVNGNVKNGLFGPFTLSVSHSKKEVDGAASLVANSVSEQSVQAVRLVERQPGNTDLSLTVAAYQAEAGVLTWNNFAIKVGSTSITNVTWTLTDADGIAISYLNNNNFQANITHNITYLTNVAFSAPGDGTFDINNTVTYLKNGVKGVFWIVYELAVADASGTSYGRSARSIKSQSAVVATQANAQANGVQYIRVEYALGAAVAGIALVASVAVIGAMVMLRKKNTSNISV